MCWYAILAAWLSAWPCAATLLVRIVQRSVVFRPVYIVFMVVL